MARRSPVLKALRPLKKPFERLAGWRYAFMILAPGPLFGVISMLRLRRLPEAVKIAQGRR